MIFHGGVVCFHLCSTPEKKGKTFSIFTQYPQLISVFVLDFVVTSEVKLWYNALGFRSELCQPLVVKINSRIGKDLAEANLGSIGRWLIAPWLIGCDIVFVSLKNGSRDFFRQCLWSIAFS